MTPWKYSADGLTASRVRDDGFAETRLVSAIDARELIGALPADPVVPQPNAIGFQNDIKITMGGILGANALMAAYPAFIHALQQGVWADVQALIIDANTTAKVTPAQYAAIKAAAMANNIPIVLP